MKKIIAIFTAALLLTQTNCTFRKGNLDKLWFYMYSSGIHESEDTTLTPASFMDLQPDKTYTFDLGGFDYGHWEKKDSLLVLRSTKGFTVSFPIKHFFGNELSLQIGTGAILNFEGRPGRFSSPADNPFSLENNQWRVPATKKESEKELKTRLRNHCKFYEIYFRWALETGLSSIDVRSTPSLLKMYGNGFALKKFEELPALWRSYFYDEEDCRNASAIIKNIFDHKDIAWANTDNRFKMFISAFQQLQQFIK
ncbi:MAG: hypothetical protein Q8941_04435 [Bacteroidota bacterium]|nr:hypothetical protein [Bacteroidota bacterium]